MNRLELKQHFKSYCQSRWPEDTAKNAAREYEVCRSMIYMIWSDRNTRVIPNGRMCLDMQVSKLPEEWVSVNDLVFL